ncbi:MAG: hypothetical protein ACLRSD_00395 [Oscillibacter sp.]
MPETKLPCVVKPVANGSSVGVSIAHTGAELKTALEVCLQFGAQVVLEQVHLRPRDPGWYHRGQGTALHRNYPEDGLL